ncbi:MAG: phage shock protein PspA [Geminicoccaceae bacterium]
MGIFSRLADIINANLNAALDRAEDPEKMIRQMIHEMEDTLVEVRANAARMIADRKGLERRRGNLDEAQGEWQRKAELALSKDREDLARAALTEKARLAQDLTDLDEELVHLDEALVKYEEDIGKLEAKLREAKAKQKVIVARQATATSRLRVRRQVHDRRIDDAFVRFEQMERRLDAAESEVEAFDLGRGRTLAEEIDDLASNTVVEEELKELKSKLGKGQAPSGEA